MKALSFLWDLLRVLSFPTTIILGVNFLFGAILMLFGQNFHLNESITPSFWSIIISSISGLIFLRISYLILRTFPLNDEENANP